MNFDLPKSFPNPSKIYPNPFKWNPKSSQEPPRFLSRSKGRQKWSTKRQKGSKPIPEASQNRAQTFPKLIGKTLPKKSMFLEALFHDFLGFSHQKQLFLYNLFLRSSIQIHMQIHVFRGLHRASFFQGVRQRQLRENIDFAL